MVFDVKATVNPLVYMVSVRWEEDLPGSLVLKVWNLMQKWLVKNDCVQNGNIATSPTSIIANIIVKRRLGNPKNESP